ncbi:MAG: hypothetical protein IKW99_07025 [Bacteroidales bacterium]|nr:hypothetical protein [Bacteroidales bacterium]
MDTKKLDFMATLKETTEYGLKNVVSLLLMAVLYIVTVWIPYLNVGTTIGLYKGIVEISKGKILNPMILFDKQNFQNIGNFFLLVGIMLAAIGPAYLMGIIPGIVLGIAWGFAIFFLIDKGLSPIECLRTSYDATYGEKWTIFFLYLVVSVVCSILAFLFMRIPKVGWLFVLIIAVITVAILIALEAVLYKHFSAKAFPEDETIPEATDITE